jgi:hypothetical protein
MIKSAEEFVRLRNSEIRQEYIRSADEAASIEIWFEVIERFHEMKVWVAHNKTVPVAVLELLANDTDPRVRFEVATKRKLTTELFELLANDPDESVRQRIAYNSKTPTDILKRLKSDPEKIVREAALKRLEALES